MRTTLSASTAGPWIAVQDRRPRPAVRLFCLPWAGGGASAYATWRTGFRDDVQVCPIELPGRQKRWREPAYQRIEPLAEALGDALAGELDTPYALFGHSMGALVAFELARTLRRRGLPAPLALFASGGFAPHLGWTKPKIHDQPDAVVVERLRALGGLPDEAFAEPELLELLLPTIRADFAVCETYSYRAEGPLNCSIVAYAGADDHEVPPARVAPWREHTSGSFEMQVLPGGHFFLETAREQLLESMRTRLVAP